MNVDPRLSVNTATYGPYSASLRSDTITDEAIRFFSESACPVMAWALVSCAAVAGRTWTLALIGDEDQWGDWWHMGALTEGHTWFVDITGAHDPQAIVEVWHEKRQRTRRHPGNASGLRPAPSYMFDILRWDPRQVDEPTREVAWNLADLAIASAPGPATSRERSEKRD
jgi:hypothetical protein